jgi:DNA-binding transcriptional regulator YbjK
MANNVEALATDLDKAPTGEVIIERLLTAQVSSQRRIENLEARVALLTQLVDSHQHTLEAASMKGGIVQ